MKELKEDIILLLRDMARRGDSVGAMFRVLQDRLKPDASSCAPAVHIITTLAYMRSAFCLTLREAKPLVALSHPEYREVTDEALVNEHVMPEIEKHRSEWDVQRVSP